MTATKRFMIFILLFAAGIRVGLLAYASTHPERFDFPDSRRYVTVARNIGAGNGPVESPIVLAGTDPVYPAMLAIGIYAGIETDDGIMQFGRALNSAFGVIVVFLVFHLGKMLFNDRVGLLAAAAAAVYPILLYFNALALTELPYIAMLLATIIAMLRWRESARAQWLWLAGGLFGFAALTRSSSLFLIFAFVPWLLFTTIPENSKSGKGKGILALFVGFVIVMGPIVIRNYRLFDAFVPVRTGGGASLLEAMGPWADGGPGMEKIAYPLTPKNANEVERDRVYQNAAIEWAMEHPGDVARLALAKLRRTWSVTMNAAGYQSGIYALVCWMTVFPLFVLALAGAWHLRRQKWGVSFLLVPAAYFTLLHMVFVGSVRYRLPATPMLMILAAVAIDAALTVRDERRRACES